VDSVGNVYAADSGNHTLRRGKIVASSISLAPVFQTIAASNGIVVFTWSAVSGRSYQAQYKTNLIQTNWVNLGGVRVATSMRVRDSLEEGTSRFYADHVLSQAAGLAHSIIHGSQSALAEGVL
jgi:hypothetical protein